MRFANETFEKKRIVKRRENKACKSVVFCNITLRLDLLIFPFILNVSFFIIFFLIRLETGRGSENQLLLAITFCINSITLCPTQNNTYVNNGYKM